MPSFKKFYKENRKKAIQSQKNSLKLLQLLMILCSYNFIKFSMCSYNFNVAFRISINPRIWDRVKSNWGRSKIAFYYVPNRDYILATPLSFAA